MIRIWFRLFSVSKEMRQVFAGVGAFVGIEILSFFLHALFRKHPQAQVIIVVSLLGRSIYGASVLSGFATGWLTRKKGYFYGGLAGFGGILVTLCLAMFLTALTYSSMSGDAFVSSRLASAGAVQSSWQELWGVLRLLVMASVGGFFGEFVSLQVSSSRR